MKCYENVLRQFEEATANGCSIRKEEEDLKQSAAYNLALIYKNGGNFRMAQQILFKHIEVYILTWGSLLLH